MRQHLRSLAPVMNDGQTIFRDLGGLKLPDICLTGEEKTRKNLTQEICPNRGSNPGPLHDRRTCYHLVHSSGPRREKQSIVKVNDIQDGCAHSSVNYSLFYFITNIPRYK